jgi:replicative DNA helicase
MIKDIPQSENYEKSVLSSVLQKPEVMDDLVEGGVTRSTFYVFPLVWDAIKELYDDDKPIELVSFTQYLAQKDRLEMMGGGSKLTEIYTYSPTDAHLEYHTKKLRDLEFRRNVLMLTKELETSAYDLNEDPVSMLLEPVDDLIEGRFSSSESSTGKEATEEWFNDWEEQLTTGASTSVIPSGLDFIDQARGGFDFPSIVYVGALPGGGKTALAVQLICYQLKADAEARLLFFSLEMTREEIIQRCMIHLCAFEDPRWIMRPSDALRDWAVRQRAEGNKVNGKNPPKFVMEKIAAAFKLLSSERLIIEDEGGQSIDIMLSKAKVHQRKGKIKWVFLDHIQLASGASKKTTPEQAVTEVTRGVLRGMKMTGAIWVGLSQLTEGDGKPKFKYASSILEDAHLSLRIMKEREESEVTGIKCTKDRKGPCTGRTFPVEFDGSKQIFKKSLKEQRDSLA